MIYEYNAEITSVYDGDTVTATIDLGFNLYTANAKIRLIGINTPELRGGTEATKAAGLAARDYVRERILNKHVRIISRKKGKYGRYLAEIYELNAYGEAIHQSLNEQLIVQGHAVPYLS